MYIIKDWAGNRLEVKLITDNQFKSEKDELEKRIKLLEDNNAKLMAVIQAFSGLLKEAT